MLKQLVDLKYDVKGLIRHGLSMAEKAAKGSYKKIALIGYDESVRERAGEVGPSAFGTVEYDDIFRFFCADNTISKKTQPKKVGQRTSRVESDKYCIRYNNGGCHYASQKPAYMLTVAQGAKSGASLQRLPGH